MHSSSRQYTLYGRSFCFVSQPELAIKAFQIAAVNSVDDFPEKLKTTIGHLYSGGYRPSETKRIYKAKDLSKIVGDSTKHNEESIFYDTWYIYRND